MAEDQTNFELIKLLDLPEGTPLDERLWRWSLAFDAWLGQRRTNHGRATARASYRSWRDFLDMTGKFPWEVSTADINAYVRALEARGLRPNTISKHLTGLRSFYAYCQENAVDPLCGPGYNPVTGVQRPEWANYENVRFLTEKEENALLQALQQDDLPISKRDYALFLTLLRTGWKAGVVRTLTWGALKRGDEDMGSGSKAVPAEVREAIQDYLQASGRIDSIREEEYVFAPIKYRFVSERLDGPEDWDGGRPLSQQRLNLLVKQHAQAAGLRAKAISCHTLRHTAAARYLKGAESPDALGAYLGRRGKRAIRQYVRRLKKSPKGRLKARRRANSGQKPLPSRKMRRIQPGQQMTLTHGLKAKRLPEFEWLAEKGIELDPLDAAVLRWRFVIRRVTILWNYIETFEEAVLLLKAMGQACMNLVRAIKLREQIRAMMPEIEAEVELPEWYGEEEL